MSYLDGRRTIVQPRRVRRPLGVTIVMCFQLFKAAILITTAILLKLSPHEVTDSQSVLYPLLYIAMRGNSSVIEAAMQGGDVLSGIILLLSLYLIVAAFGLWAMHQWARRSVIITSAVTILLYAKSTFLPSTVAEGSTANNPMAPENMVCFYVLLAIDTLMFIFFLRTSTEESFIHAEQEV